MNDDARRPGEEPEAGGGPAGGTPPQEFASPGSAWATVPSLPWLQAPAEPVPAREAQPAPAQPEPAATNQAAGNQAATNQAAGNQAAAETAYQPAYQPPFQPPYAQPQQQPYQQPYQQPQAWQPPAESPAPAPGRGRLFLGLVVGLLAGALIAGTAGYFAGAGTGGAKPKPTPTASPSPSMPAFEANQLALTQAKLSGDLAPMAKPWLTTVGGCLSNTDIGGPPLPKDEKAHVFCRYGGVAVHFALFKAKADRDFGRTYRQQLNLDADGLAPGLEQPSRKMGGVTHVSGNYVEYAFKGGDGRAVCGVWWDRDDSDTAALLMETLCEEGLGGKWAPLRDLWQRHS